MRTLDSTDASLIASLRGLGRDGRSLFALRTVRMFGYGFLAVVLVLYLDASGLDLVRGRRGGDRREGRLLERLDVHGTSEASK